MRDSPPGTHLDARLHGREHNIVCGCEEGVVARGIKHDVRTGLELLGAGDAGGPRAGACTDGSAGLPRRIRAMLGF